MAQRDFFRRKSLARQDGSRGATVAIRAAAALARQALHGSLEVLTVGTLRWAVWSLLVVAPPPRASAMADRGAFGPRQSVTSFQVASGS